MAIHHPCLVLLTKVLTGSDSFGDLDRDLLYHIMHDLIDFHGLDLDYGDVSQALDQYWSCKPGEEPCKVLVANPLRMLDVRKSIKAYDSAVCKPKSTNPAPLDLGGSVMRDPFMELPYDILYEITRHLPSHSVIALSSASWPAFCAFRENDGFWKRALVSSMPWFWELHDWVRESAATDFRGLFLWLEKVTTPKIDMQGPFLGVANRRRIWGVCERLAARYLPRVVAVATGSHDASESHDAARTVWGGCSNPYMPLVTFPEHAEGTSTVTTQWVCSWKEISGQEGVFETFWDASRSLVGLALSFAGDRRLFGRDDRDGDVLKEAVMVRRGDEIMGLVLHLPDVSVENMRPARLSHLIDHEESNLRTSIKGITVQMACGEERLGDTNQTYNRRALVPNDDYFVAGVVGHISGSGTINRLGLVQCPRYGVHISTDSPGEPQIPLVQKMLWKSTSTPLGFPPAAHPQLVALPYHEDPLDRYRIQANLPEDVVPAEPLIWAASEAELKSVQRISVYQLNDGRDICGAKVEFTPESGIPARVVGNGVAVGTKSEDDAEIGGEWQEQFVVGFDIDGPGGEVVTAVEVMHDEEIKAMKLRTNRDREVYWGEHNMNNVHFHPATAGPGETIVGIALGFGSQGGFTWTDETYGYSLMNWAATLVMSLQG
ncbi:uncharacterized protein K452DRAFT_312984 [Aplosporella prunicola CBS 121167]|uniref:F-box domain-containing protein n=1 Tax=Aplosporella prunicola CBS 121167 TaxID=1176127 RepID=A0A6A6B1U4_9PEZI|nr:uncharacterized protein K452DRAFT_312984 [Aplosporella prunicola CBS 121167]KAF2136701.1 hypothetical protein K452DRAFT_312984 [Aplosporella prunicola CBS 121167]